jgi:peptidoglycan biosynthesis protein MviN/MurJ (putative lipid II flippase)
VRPSPTKSSPPLAERDPGVDLLTSKADASAEVRDAAAISFGYAGATVLGGVLALLIAHFFGKTARTDAFFAAYGVYWVSLVFAQTIRLAAVPQLLSGKRDESADQLLASVIVLGLVALIPMVLLAGVLGPLLIEHDPLGVATDSLRTLWPALACQLIAGALAAILAVRGSFLTIGFGYILSGLISIGAFLILRSAAGIQAVPIALSLSGASLATLMAVRLISSGWHPTLLNYLRLRPVAEESRLLLLASGSFTATNLGFVLCLAIASRDGTGQATIYAYAYFAATLLVSMTAVSAAVVRTTKALSPSTNQALSWANSLSTYRFAIVIVLPALALASLFGKPIIELLLGDAFADADATRLVVTLLSLSGWILGSAASVLAIMQLLGNRRYSLVAILSFGQLGILFPLALLGRALAGVAGIGAAQSMTTLVGTVPLVYFAFQSDWVQLGKGLGASTLKGAACLLLTVAPGFIALATLGRSPGAMTLAATCALVLAAGLTALAWPEETRVLLGAASRRSYAEAKLLGPGEPARD